MEEIPNEEYFEGLNFEELSLNELNFSTLRKYGEYLTTDNYRNMKYSRDQIRRFLTTPHQYERQLREVSRYLYVSSSHYYRLINYLADMLILSYIVVPDEINEQKFKKKTFDTYFNKVVNYVNSYNLQTSFRDIIGITLLEDVFFGVERKTVKSTVIQRLNPDYCKIVGFENDNFVFEFNMQYFDNRVSNNNQEAIDLLSNFPDEFKVMYNDYIVNRKKWQIVPSDISVCFKFNRNQPNCFPPFVQIYEEIMDIEDNKELKQMNKKSDNFKLIVQKIPFKKDPKSERDFLINLTSVKKFHKNIRSSVPQGIGVISTPMDLKEISFERKVGIKSNDDIDAEKSLFNSAGVSGSLFLDTEHNSVALNRSINQDESLMFKILRQFETFFKYKLYDVTSTVKFKIFFPDLTIYNRDKLFDTYLKAGSSGFPKSLAGCALGLSTPDLIALNKLENTYLNILDDMIPFTSSWQASDKSAGREEKDENDLTPNGEKTRITDANNKKAK